MAITKKMTNDMYVLLNDAYYGEGGFADGSYLTPHKRESDQKYKERQELAYYLNYIKPCVDSHVNAVFASEPQREYSDKNGLYKQFILDADANGNSLNRMMKNNGLGAKLKGACLIVVDNFNRIPDNVEDTKENRILPYIFKVECERIIESECELDDKKRIVKVTYYEDDYIAPDGKTYKMKREWDREATRLYQQIVNFGMAVTWEMTEETFHNLNMLPCFFLYGIETVDNAIIPTSEFLHPAKVNKAIYNICSEIREIQRKQTFSILIKPGDPPNEGETVGTENVMYFPSDATNVPAYIAPPDGPLVQLGNNVKELISEIYRMSCVSYTQQFATAQSGESKRWTFHVTRQILEDFAVNCEIAEQKIAKIFGAWINHDLQAVITYNRMYGADDIDADIERTVAVLSMDLTDKVKAEVQKKFVRSYFSSSDDTLIKMLEQSIDDDLLEKETDDDMGNDDSDLEDETMNQDNNS